jgi:hypothetical protein
VERGTHASLYAKGGRYYDLYTKQHGVESNLFLAPGEGGTESKDGQNSEVESTSNAGASALPEAIRIIRGQN